jgi:acetamidase/formamidase
MRIGVVAALLAGWVGATVAEQNAIQDIPLTPANVHWGYYDSRLKPIATIASGGRFRIETMVAGGLQRLRLAGVAESEIPDALKQVETAITERGPGAHPMTGPIDVEGAAPGDVLEIRIQSIDYLHPFGVNAFAPGGGVLPDEFPYATLKVLRWKPGADRVTFAPGVTLPLAPFFGSIGVAPPPLAGRISSRAPGWHGGNLDNKDLIAGTTLYLPVHVAGALLSIGDGHAMQGDGEVTGTALETSLRGTFEVYVRKGRRLKWPRAETPTHYIAMGLHEDLDEAARLAVRELVEFLMAEKKLLREDAYMLCSLAASLRVTQAVDATKGIHAMLAKSIFTAP